MPSVSLGLRPDASEVPFVDANLMITDGTMDINRKLKKAFCEPKNVEVCPVLTLAKEVTSIRSMLRADNQRLLDHESCEKVVAICINYIPCLAGSMTGCMMRENALRCLHALFEGV